MSSTFRAGAVIYAKDLERMAAFYENVLGLARVETERGHVLLASAAFELVVHAIPAEIAAGIEIASPPRPRSDGAIKLAFAVESLAAVRDAAPRFGGSLGGPAREWEFRGTRGCDGRDPEGNVFQVRTDAAG